MKFYEVQQALEEGKKIRRSDMNGYLIFDGRVPNSKKIRYVLSGACVSHPYHIGESELLADDWEIVEDIPEIQLFRSKDILYTCPRCGRNHEQLVYTEDRPETIHECYECGQKFRFGNLDEMKRMYYGSPGQTIPDCLSLKEAVKIADDILGSCKKRRMG